MPFLIWLLSSRGSNKHQVMSWPLQNLLRPGQPDRTQLLKYLSVEAWPYATGKRIISKQLLPPRLRLQRQWAVGHRRFLWRTAAVPLPRNAGLPPSFLWVFIQTPTPRMATWVGDPTRHVQWFGDPKNPCGSAHPNLFGGSHVILRVYDTYIYSWWFVWQIFWQMDPLDTKQRQFWSQTSNNMKRWKAEERFYTREE